MADTLGVARSNLVEQLAGRSKRQNRYHRQGDDELLASIRQLTDARGTVRNSVFGGHDEWKGFPSCPATGNLPFRMLCWTSDLLNQ